MIKRKHNKILLLAIIISCVFALTSCIMDRVIPAFHIKNSSSDTLYIEISELDTLDNSIYWCEDTNGTTPPIYPIDTTWTYINGEKIVIDNWFYALPDSTVLVSPYSFEDKDTCYIYAIKKQIITRYTLDEIRAKKLYDRRAVTKRDFHNRLFEYRATDKSSPSH